jgi:hypothetical protein
VPRPPPGDADWTEVEVVSLVHDPTYKGEWSSFGTIESLTDPETWARAQAVDSKQG